MSDKPKIEYKQNALDNDKLKLRTQNSQGKTAMAQVSVFRNNPRFTVFTAEPELMTEDNPHGIIQCPMGAVDFEQFLELLRRVTGSRDNQDFVFGCKTAERDEEGKIISIVDLSMIHVGRDDKGVYLTFKTPSFTRGIRFYFTMSDFHYILKQDGEALSRSEASMIAALAWMRIVEKLFPMVMNSQYYEYTKEEKVRSYVPNKAREQGRGYQKGNYSNRDNGQNRGGYNNNNRGDYQNYSGGGYQRAEKNYPKKPYNSRYDDQPDQNTNEPPVSEEDIF